MSLLDKLMRRAGEQQIEIARKYRKLVRDVADRRDKNIDPDEAAAILEAIGKTAEDLKAEAQQQLDRREKRKGLKRETADRNRIAHCQAAMDELDAEAKAINEKYRREWKPLHEEAERLRSRLAGYDRIREELAQSCPDSELQERQAAIGQERRQLAAEARKILDGDARSMFDERHKGNVLQLQQRISKAELRRDRDPNEIEQLKAKLRHVEGAYKSAVAKLNEIKAAMDAIDVEQNDLTRQMMNA